MKLVTLALKSTFNRKSSVLVTLLTIAISCMLLLSIERVRVEAKQSFSNTLSGTDLIVGARTGDIQLLLASVFRIGYTNNGVSWQSYLDITSQRGVAWAIPLSLGDSHKGFAVLGSDSSYFQHYRYGKKQLLSFAQGGPFQQADQVVLGSEVAATLGYQLGDKIVVSHGMGKTSFHHHDAHPLTVVGILKPTGTPVDKTLHIPLRAIADLHNEASSTPHEHEHHEDDHQHNETPDLIGEPTQITAFLLGFESPLYTLQVRRNINQYKHEALLAIMPTVTLRDLWTMLSMVEKLLMLFSAIVVIVSLLGMLTTMLASLAQRRRELAILRSVGARPWHIVLLLTAEAALITSLGCALGVGLFYLLVASTEGFMQSQFGVNLSLTLLSHNEMGLIALIITAGTLMGLVPALKAYFYSLADGMSIKL
ncbi:ABC transporter permease [Pseudoalteromonas fenneropenaei]|uniref:ABC transporter permease n=1 Tax=Pseudoalteromonas fenneropenaei TaxID=1737459 RepID=A0ABV7CPH9_9GAMM